MHSLIWCASTALVRPAPWISSLTLLRLSLLWIWLKELWPFRRATFMQRDPSGEINGGMNLYSAFANDPVNNVDPDGLSAASVIDPLAELPGERSRSQVYAEAVAAVNAKYGLSGNIAASTVIVAHKYWFDQTYGGLVTSLANAKESWYESQGIHVYSDAIYQQDLATFQAPRGIRPDTRTPEQKALDADIVYGKEHPELPPPMGSILLRQSDGSLAGALWGATKIAAPDLAGAWAGLKLNSGGIEVMGNVRRGAAADALPTLEISAARYPALAENIRHAQLAGHPDVLTYGGDIAGNREAALWDVPAIPPLSRDEYPFASTLEGGEGSWVGHIPRSQQHAQGALLKNFYKSNNIQPGAQFRVTVGE